jgi:hypothetical protein
MQLLWACNAIEAAAAPVHNGTGALHVRGALAAGGMRCTIVAPTWLLMSSPTIGRVFSRKRWSRYSSRAMKTGIQLTMAQPASRICSTHRPPRLR